MSHTSPYPRIAADPTLPSNMIGVERSVTVTEAATAMGADASTVRKLIRTGALRGYRLGKRGVRIYVSSIQDYQEQNEFTPEGDQPKTKPAPLKRRDSAAHREALAGLAALGILKPTPVR